jgi:hypothetical protein
VPGGGPSTQARALTVNTPPTMAHRPVRNSKNGVDSRVTTTMKGEMSYTQKAPGSTFCRMPFTIARRKEDVTEYCGDGVTKTRRNGGKARRRGGDREREHCPGCTTTADAGRLVPPAQTNAYTSPPIQPLPPPPHSPSRHLSSLDGLGRVLRTLVEPRRHNLNEVRKHTRALRGYGLAAIQGVLLTLHRLPKIQTGTGGGRRAGAGVECGVVHARVTPGNTGSQTRRGCGRGAPAGQAEGASSSPPTHL